MQSPNFELTKPVRPASVRSRTKKWPQWVVRVLLFLERERHQFRIDTACLRLDSFEEARQKLRAAEDKVRDSKQRMKRLQAQLKA